MKKKLASHILQEYRDLVSASTMLISNTRKVNIVSFQLYFSLSYYVWYVLSTHCILR